MFDIPHKGTNVTVSEVLEEHRHAITDIAAELGQAPVRAWPPGPRPWEGALGAPAAPRRGGCPGPFPVCGSAASPVPVQAVGQPRQLPLRCRAQAALTSLPSPRTLAPEAAVAPGGSLLFGEVRTGPCCSPYPSWLAQRGVQQKQVVMGSSSERCVCRLAFQSSSFCSHSWEQPPRQLSRLCWQRSASSCPFSSSISLSLS